MHYQHRVMCTRGARSLVSLIFFFLLFSRWQKQALLVYQKLALSWAVCKWKRYAKLIKRSICRSSIQCNASHHPNIFFTDIFQQSSTTFAWWLTYWRLTYVSIQNDALFTIKLIYRQIRLPLSIFPCQWIRKQRNLFRDFRHSLFLNLFFIFAFFTFFEEFSVFFAIFEVFCHFKSFFFKFHPLKPNNIMCHRYRCSYSMHSVNQ